MANEKRLTEKGKTMREKLIELLKGIKYTVFPNSTDLYSFGIQHSDHVFQQVADNLLANGVTVSDCIHDCKNCWKTQLCNPKWIPVTERLPNHFASVLVQMPGEKPFPTVHEGFLLPDGLWYVRMFTHNPEDITHWMPLPEPPKGDSI